MQTLKRSATVLLLALALVACSDDEKKPEKDAGSEEETEADAEVEEEADADVESDAGASASSDTVPLTVWVDDLIEHRTSDEAEPDTVDDKKISDDTDETSFDKYLP
jgi:PBP1b-binding outer membrane lipoprotein LpoB